jgi:hypothetical protein
MPVERIRRLVAGVSDRPGTVLLAAALGSFVARGGLILERGTWAADYSSSDIGQIAYNVAKGEGFLFMGMPSSFFGPVFVYLWAFALRIGGETGQLAVQLFQAALLSVAPLCLYSFARLRFAVLPALASAVIFAFYPELLALPTTMYADTLALFLWCACLALYAAVLRSRPAAIAPTLALGVCMGLTALTKGRLLLFAALLLPFLAANDPASLRGLFRPSALGLRTALIAGAVTAAALAPWVVRNLHVHGELLLLESTSGLNLWMGHNENATGTGKATPGVGGAADPARDGADQAGFPRSPELTAAFRAAPTELARDRVLRDAALRAIREDPAREIPLSFRKILYFWTIDPTSTIARSPAYWAPWAATFVLAIVGIRDRRAHGHADALPMSLLLLATALAVAFFVIPRLRYPTYPIVFLFAGQGVARLLAPTPPAPADAAEKP